MRHVLTTCDSHPKESWLGQIIATMTFSSVVVVILGLWIPTDSPRQPGDEWRAVGKAYIGLAVTWLFFRWYARHRARCDSSTPAPHSSPGNPNPPAAPAAEGKI